jgi:hypothetical protein
MADTTPRRYLRWRLIKQTSTVLQCLYWMAALIVLMVAFIHSH